MPVSMLPGARVLSRAEVGPGPSSTAWAGGRLWLGDEFGLAELDPTNGTILRRLELGPLASVAAVPGVDKLVVASYVEEYVAVLDPATDALIDRTHVPCPRELGVQSVTEVWVTAPCIDQVARVVIGREVAGTVRVSQPGPIAIGGGAVWVVGDQSVVRIDPSTMSKTTVYPVMLGFPADIAFLESASDAAGLWVTAFDVPPRPGGALVRIDPETRQAQRIGEGSAALSRPLDSIAVEGDTVWVVGVPPDGDWFEVPRVLTGVDPESAAIEEELVLPPGSVILSAGPEPRELWVGSSLAEVVSVRAQASDVELPPAVRRAADGLQLRTTEFAGRQPVTVYLPRGEPQLPTFVLVGGGPEPPSAMHHMSPLATALADQGAVVYVIGYRSEATGHTYNETVADIRCAVAFARVGAPEFGASDRFTLVGFSYGGEAVLTAATNPGEASADCAASEHTAPDAVIGLDPLPIEAAGEGTAVPVLLVGALRQGNAFSGRTFAQELISAGYDVQFAELDVSHAGVIDPASSIGLVDLILEFARGVAR